MRLSVLDQSTVVSGRSPDASIRESIALAQHAEALGYARYWCAEHPNSASIAGSAPEILIAAIVGEYFREFADAFFWVIAVFDQTHQSFG